MCAELDANTILYDIYYSPSGPETDSRRKVFFAASVKAWSVGVVEVLQQLEETMVGTFALGDQVVSPHSESSPCPNHRFV